MAMIDRMAVAQRDLTLTKVRETSGYNPRFADWLLVNWQTWLDFKAAADKVRERSFVDYSAYVIINVLRWRANVRGHKFAMSNTMTPDLARLYNQLHPEVQPPLFKTSTRFAKGISHG